ncbi:MAG: hypothetical protein JXR37_09165 [Kiritimatiellae bacterium]|nr:hypothetical protein [Kiritimatiellia bacterium]
MAVGKPAIDSVEARTIATRVLQWHQASFSHAQRAVISAVACGIQLAKGREQLPHGAFRKWSKKYFPMISERSVTNYLAITSHLRLKSPRKMATVANLLDCSPDKMSDTDYQHVGANVQNLVDGRSVRGLLEDAGAIKPKNTKVQRGKEREDRRVRLGLSEEEFKQREAKEWAEQVGELLGMAEVHGKYLVDNDLLTLVANAMPKAYQALGLAPNVTEEAEASAERETDSISSGHMKVIAAGFDVYRLDLSIPGIKQLAKSEKRTTSGQKVGRSWQTWKRCVSQTAAKLAWRELMDNDPKAIGA